MCTISVVCSRFKTFSAFLFCAEEMCIFNTGRNNILSTLMWKGRDEDG